VEAAQQELAEASGVFDVAEYRLDGPPAQPVAAAKAGACISGFRLSIHPAVVARAGRAAPVAWAARQEGR